MNLFIINTNKQKDNRYEREMLKEKKCAAYRSTKHKIEEIQAGDKVLLYSNEVGVIARGIASGELKIQEDNGEPSAEYYMFLEQFYELVIPITYSQVVKLIKKYDPKFSRPFNQTALKFTIPFSEKIWSEVNNYI